MTTMTARTATIRRATPDETDTIATVLAAAFLHGDLGPWLVPHIDTRSRVYGPYFRIFTEHAQTSGRIDVTDDVCAAAIWYPIGHTVDLDIPAYDTRLAQACGEHLNRFVALDRTMHIHHPTGSPHHYLAFLGVHPDRQRQGLGRALLDHHHHQLDTDGIPAYLEATSPRTSTLYRRHGYTPEQAYTVPNGPAAPNVAAPTPHQGDAIKGRTGVDIR